MYDHDDMSGFDNYIASFSPEYQMMIVEYSQCPYSILNAQQSTFEKMVTMKRGSFDLDVILYNDDPANTLEFSTNINELLPLIGESTIHKYQSCIVDNENLNEHWVKKLFDMGIVDFSPLNPNIPEEVTHHMLNNGGQFCKGKVMKSDLGRLDPYMISVNPHLPQHMYRNVINRGGDVYSMLDNPGVDMETIKCILDKVGLDVANVVAKNPTVTQEFLDQMGDVRYYSAEMVDNYMNHNYSMDILHNRNLTDELRIRFLSHPNFTLTDVKGKEVTNFLNGAQSIEVFDEFLKRSDIISSAEMFFRIRDEVELLSSHESSARWAMRYAPNIDIAHECHSKYPKYDSDLLINHFLKG